MQTGIVLFNCKLWEDSFSLLENEVRQETGGWNDTACWIVLGDLVCVCGYAYVAMRVHVNAVTIWTQKCRCLQ